MATRLFEDRIHAAFYQKYRFAPQENLQRAIFSYLEKKDGASLFSAALEIRTRSNGLKRFHFNTRKNVLTVNSFQLAVDVGCGSGQSTLFLAKHFEKVVGMDISAAQIEEAKRAPHPPNVSYAVSPAEDLPFEAGSVDLITAFASVHWFDTPRFLGEVDRVLKPSGCVVFSSYNQDMRVCYRDLTEKLTQIFTENREQLFNYADEKVKGVLNDYQEVFDALPYADKERITDIVDKVPMSIADLMGYIQSLSMYQAFQKAQPEAAKALLQNTERRFLETMGVSSRETQVELEMRHVCILGCKMS